MCDFGGVELPPHKYLIARNSSSSAGDQRANRFKLPLTGKFVGAAMAGALVLSPMTATAQQPTAQPASWSQTTECAPLRQNSVGRIMNAGSSAWDYSDQNPGKIGIAVFPGQDLGDNTPEEVGTWLVRTLATAGVEAECFVQTSYGKNGTGIDFLVNGSSWMDIEQRDVRFNLEEIRDADRLRSMVAEAKTGKVLLTSASISGNDPSP
ncbi:hypothetical protein [Litorimonas sp.]|uniref:hypothetical protein n=1 Tax=Litorimonas sp. TaxID=1892381 RepID=UPI003A8A63D0